MNIDETVRQIINDEIKQNKNKLAMAYSLISEYEKYNWFKIAIRAVNYCVKKNGHVAADDVWECLEGYNNNLIKPNSNNSMGLVFKICKKSKMIKATDKFRKSRRKSANGRDIRIWVEYFDSGEEQ